MYGRRWFHWARRVQKVASVPGESVAAALVNYVSCPSIIFISDWAAGAHNQVFFNNLWDRFEEIDKDHDRHLDIGEFARGAALVGVQLRAEDVEFEFQQCDSSGDGTIVREATRESF